LYDIPNNDRFAAAVIDPTERFATYYGRWASAYTRGEAAVMREVADAALAETQNWPETSFPCAVHRMQGVTCWIGEGDITGALAHLQRAVALHDPERDRESAFHFGQDIGVSAKAYLGLVLWIARRARTSANNDRGDDEPCCPG
jgi:hypothetical protein